MPKPVAVVTGDVHFTLATMELATNVVKQMKLKAKELGVPVILNGDTLDSKAIVRGEIMNRLIELVRTPPAVDFIFNTGNHDLISEKGDESCLSFLKPYAKVIDIPTLLPNLNIWAIPYQNNSEVLRGFLQKLPKKSTLLLHQGVQSAFLGHYTQDKTSLPPDAFKDFRIIASHYHRRQDIKCGKTGLFSYVGNPYSLSFGEASDGPKGYSILMDDGSLEFVPTNLRKHVVVETTMTRVTPETKNMLWACDPLSPEDLLWLKVKGPKSELKKLDKQLIGQTLLGHSNFKLDLIPTDAGEVQVLSSEVTDGQILDSLIDSTGETLDQKQTLKELWRDVLDE